MPPSTSVNPLHTNQTIRSLPFSEGCLLFQTGTRKIWALNHSAAFLWSLLETTADLKVLALQLAHTFKISLSQAIKDTEAAMVSFRADGLLGMSLPGQVDSTEQAIPLSLPATNAVRLHGVQWVERFSFSLPHHRLEFCSSDTDIALEFRKAMRHFEGSVCSPGSSSQLCIARCDSLKRKFDIYLNGRLFSSNIPKNDAIITLLYCTFSLATEILSDKILFHAAVLERAGMAFIFPGDSGSGKTTLAALLCKKDFRYISDELAVVDPDTGLITPLPLPMSIKKGAWPILRPLYPELDTHKIYVRADRKEVRVFAPEVMSDMNGPKEIAPAALIFPRFDPISPAKTQELAKSDAIRRLASSCSSSRPLTERDIATIIRLVDNHPCFSVTYSHCEVVEELLDDIMKDKRLP